MEKQTPQNLDRLAADLVIGREFGTRTPHVYAHRVVSRLCEVRADAELQDTVAFEPVHLPEVDRHYPDLPQTLAA